MFKAQVEEKSFNVTVDGNSFIVDDSLLNWDLQKISENHYHILFNNKSYSAEIVNLNHETKTVQVKINGHPYQIKLQDRFDLLLEKMGINGNSKNQINSLKAPMPGLILDVKVQQGDQIKVGDSLIVLEAMKMENIIKSPREGVIKSISIKKGQSVEKNQILLEF
jgi:biotin carboxyl carrier protein